jgi:hypothetical protein
MTLGLSIIISMGVDPQSFGFPFTIYTT